MLSRASLRLPGRVSVGSGKGLPGQPGRALELPGHPKLANRGPPHRQQEECRRGPGLSQKPARGLHHLTPTRNAGVPSTSTEALVTFIHSLIRPTNPLLNYGQRRGDVASTDPEGSRAPGRAACRPGFMSSSPATHTLSTSTERGAVRPSGSGSETPTTKPGPLSRAGEDPKMCNIGVFQYLGYSSIWGSDIEHTLKQHQEVHVAQDSRAQSDQ